jgi:hypothetical protein
MSRPGDCQRLRSARAGQLRLAMANQQAAPALMRRSALSIMGRNRRTPHHRATGRRTVPHLPAIAADTAPSRPRLRSTRSVQSGSHVICPVHDRPFGGRDAADGATAERAPVPSATGPAVVRKANPLSARPRRTLALGPPAFAIAPLLADPCVVPEPDLDILSRALGRHRVDSRFAPLDNAFGVEASKSRPQKLRCACIGRDAGDRKQSAKGFNNLTQARREHQARLQRSGAQAV